MAAPKRRSPARPERRSGPERHSALALQIGTRLRELRTGPRGLGQTQGEIALRAGVSVSFLSMIERGERSASLETLQQITGALGCTLEDLFASRTGRPESHVAYPLLAAFARKRSLNRQQVAQLLSVAKAMFED